MKQRIAIVAVTLMVIVVAIYGCGQQRGHALRKSVEKTRRELRAQNFKTDLSDFNFVSPADVAARANAILVAGNVLHKIGSANDLKLMEPIGTNVALAISPIAIVESYQTTNLWPLVKEGLERVDTELDAVCAAVVSGPLKLQPTIRPGGDMLLPLIAVHKSVARALAVRATLAMHEHDTNAMLKNISALSRMVTAWNPEPIDISHLVRFSCEKVFQQTLWESMQTDLWNESQLVALQKEWEAVKFFDGLSETAELSCANMLKTCQAERDRSFGANFGGWGVIFRDMFSSPGSSLQNMAGMVKTYTDFAQYRNYGSYQDELALLLYYRDRKEDLTRAIPCSTWSEMRSFSSATNMVPFQGAKNSHLSPRMNSRMNLRQISNSLQGGFRGQPSTLLSRAAEAEAERRIIVTAIALERFAVKNKTYPKSLAEIVPEYLRTVPVDFMDGKELRYRRLEDGRYLLYSVGLDCVDDGGEMRTAAMVYSRRGFSGNDFQFRAGVDVVWPLRATQADVDLFEKEQQSQSDNILELR